MFTLKNVRTAILVLTVAILASIFVSDVSAQGWINPEVYNSGRKVTGAHYDPFTGQIVVRTDQTKVRESYLDPNRNQIDPGSYRQVNRYETDLNGVRWHVTGTQWTSNGVPHGNLSRRRVGGSSGPVVEDRNEHVAYGAQNLGGSTQGSTNKTKTVRSNKLPQHRRGTGSRSTLGHYSPF
ncbi:hypothetical protein Pla22_12220 [Rubripirellula amarantea]|uniref:Uncharacterized protein n=1 Tax=Rubripirellula amarantea TaxID=2527999 RepID=A0A5C5WUU9_9BACT|nr:hypothetical protein [Rubripirellula amarantea]TWT53592.1 hypothetical protein Pla22_12220 [Rubripirellula amarantea]